jgi:hypothetical protein
VLAREWAWRGVFVHNVHTQVRARARLFAYPPHHVQQSRLLNCCSLGCSGAAQGTAAGRKLVVGAAHLKLVWCTRLLVPTRGARCRSFCRCVRHCCAWTWCYPWMKYKAYKVQGHQFYYSLPKPTLTLSPTSAHSFDNLL